MLQKVKGLAKSSLAFTLETVKRHYRPLICIGLTVSSIFLSGAHYSQDVHAESISSVAEAEIFRAEYLTETKKPAIEDSAFKPTSAVSALVADTTQISYLFPLEVKRNGRIYTYSVYSGALSEILDSIGIRLDKLDTTDIPLNSFISSKASVEITDIEYRTETLLEAIPFGVKVEYSDEYAAASTVVIEGEEGQQETVYSVKYVNGKVADTVLISQGVTKPATDKTIIIGTALEDGVAVPASSVNAISQLTPPADLLLDKNCVPVNYTHSVVLKATAYTHTGHNCSTGVAPMPGYVAVDPREIPYGTKMYVMSADGRFHYGYAIAADTGGFAYNSTTGMDLFFDTRGECITFGRRDIVVYFVG